MLHCWPPVPKIVSISMSREGKISNNHRNIVTKTSSTRMKTVEKYAGTDLVLQELAFWTSHVNLAFAFNDVLLPRLKLRSNSGKLLTAFLNFSWEELVRRTRTSVQLMKQQKRSKPKQNQLGVHWCTRKYLCNLLAVSQEPSLLPQVVGWDVQSLSPS